MISASGTGRRDARQTHRPGGLCYAHVLNKPGVLRTNRLVLERDANSVPYNLTILNVAICVAGTIRIFPSLFSAGDALRKYSRFV